ncbi:P2X purinoceptor 4 isoform X1 [Haemorhous mexicanus]|uniref:P2X purinoceptor 4 isoform X1 n=1 Tax=Haemorhous mexicanus TaxID=30427 RepID=UPI0028BEC6CA|nr:P2X purinoceptor 4 isoform X1 [Haemorhous mexicanus]
MALCGAFHSFLFEYDTPRIVLIRSRKVGLINRAVQLGILAYVIGWVFLWEKGYQETDSVVSSVTMKVKGVTLTNTSTLGARIWDVADYVIPPQGENTVFVMTNVILTLNQSQGRCPELPDDQTKCEVKNICVPGYVSTHSSGIQTGECVPYNNSIKTCEVFAWCPVEDDYHIPKPAFLREAENFTLLVKNNIWYRKFNFSKRNILPTINSTYLKNCIYDAQTDPFCPIFRLGKIVEAAGQDFQEMAVEGGVMALQINWDCNLDRAASHCVPKYSFRRLDNKDSAHTVSPGYNFRFAKYYKNSDGTESRTLVKAYGIRFDIIVFGKAGKFDVIPTMINIGSGLALFGVATVLCDIVVLYCMKKRYFYREKKYKYVEDYELVSISEGRVKAELLPPLTPQRF